MYVVENYWFSMAWGFGQAHIPRNYRFEDLGAEETAKIGCDLFRQGGSIVVHRKKDAFDCKTWVNRPAKAHESIEKLGDALKGQIFTLNRDQDGIAGRERVQGEKVKRRWRIDENELVAILNRLQNGLEPELPSLGGNELDGGSG